MFHNLLFLTLFSWTTKRGGKRYVSISLTTPNQSQEVSLQIKKGSGILSVNQVLDQNGKS